MRSVLRGAGQLLKSGKNGVRVRGWDWDGRVHDGYLGVVATGNRVLLPPDDSEDLLEPMLGNPDVLGPVDRWRLFRPREAWTCSQAALDLQMKLRRTVENSDSDLLDDFHGTTPHDFLAPCTNT
ncbi:hypothetical protein C4552_03040 [Candidatus Parcubacteria bacterium]|nr:MAG: hypothetical protein C4552_03040 [Candidatus Parcubacteria bacterium]